MLYKYKYIITYNNGLYKRSFIIMYYKEVYSNLSLEITSNMY